MLANALLKLLPGNALFQADELSFLEKDLLQISEKDMVKLRGGDISMIFQDPAASLSPTHSIGKQLSEVFRMHQGMGKKEAFDKSVEMLHKVGIHEEALQMKQYPHELSGGMLQRVMIAMALACKPKILIADEPTTALDVTTQKQILSLMMKLCKELGTAVILISHDLRIIAESCDSLLVMKGGAIVEAGRAEEIFRNPKAEYTQKLLSSLLEMDSFKEEINSEQGVAIQEKESLQEELLSVEALKLSFDRGRGIFRKKAEFPVVSEVFFTLYRGETLGLVGESGCGKSSLSRAILKLLKPRNGKIFFRKKDIHSLSKEELKEYRRQVQAIFQNSFSSLNPRMRVQTLLEAPLKVLGVPLSEREGRIRDILEEVGLSEAFLNRYPHELSGGQKQRIVIARALIGEAKLVLCDEPVSALDVSIQADILRLLEKCKKEKGLSYLFISHDLSVVKNICDRVMVMHQGKIVEVNSTREIFQHPQHCYTKELLASIPGRPE